MREGIDIFSIFEEDITEEVNHGIRVSNLAYYVGKMAGLYENQCHELAVAGLVHDIGKLRVSGYLYGRSEDTLKIEETRYIQMHPQLGHDLLMRYDFSDFVVESILYHHENYDGSGYPHNLAGEAIPIGARILRVCDVYAALTSDRPYRKAFDRETAVELMIDEVKNFDMKIFLAFQRTIHEEEWARTWENPGMKVQIAKEETA